MRVWQGGCAIPSVVVVRRVVAAALTAAVTVALTAALTAALTIAVPARAAEQDRRPSTTSPGRGTAAIFGLEAAGDRFVYVVDRSASMDEPDGRPLARAKRELLASIEALGDARQFHVIFYNERPMVFAPQGHRGRPIFADDESKRVLRRFVDDVGAVGGTRHYEAIAAALKLAPDAVFVLTDADVRDDLTDEEYLRLAQALRGTRCLVAQFGGGEGHSSPRLARLAAESGGEYRHVDLTGQ